MGAIFKRDFKSLFCNVIGFLFVGLMLSVFGLYFTVYNLQRASSSLQYTLIGIIHVSLFAIPLLTMRSLSEERKQKTDQLLLTAPISVFKIVFGKFLALTAVFSIVIAIVCVTPLILSMFGTVSFVENYIAILGFFLFGLVCISVGMFVSSFFESQILSAVVSFVFLFIGYIMNSLIVNLNATGILKKILQCYDFITPLSHFMNGSFEVADVIYDLSIIVLMIFLTCMGILKRRWSFSAKRIGMSVFSVAGVAVAIALCVGVNILSEYIPQKYASFDITSQKLYTLTEESKEYLATVTDDVTVYVAGKEANLDEIEAKTLSNFAKENEHIKVEYIDVDTDMTFFQQFTDSDVSFGSFCVVNGDVSRVVAYGDLYEASFDYATYSQNVTGYDGEGQLISAIQYVTQDEFTTIYLLEGHDEVTLGSSFTDMMKKANWKIESVNLLSTKSIPSDCATLIVNAPQSDLSEDDCAKILDYIHNGGNVILTYDCLCSNELKNYKNLLSDYEVIVKDGMVFDNDPDYYYQYPNVLLPNVEYSDAAESLYGNLMVIAPYTCAFEYPMFNENYSSILTTSFNASMDEKVDMNNLEEKMADAAQKAEEAAASEEDSYMGSYYTIAFEMTGEKGGRVLVYGSPYIFTNQFNELVSGRNVTLLMENLKYLIGEEDTVNNVVVPVKNMEQGKLTVPQSALLIYGLLFGVVAPVILIIFGVIFWAVRRRR